MPDDFFNSLYHLFLMSICVRPLPNFDAIFEKETLPLIMLSINASTYAVHLASRSAAFAAIFATRLASSSASFSARLRSRSAVFAAAFAAR
jgi:hypothetical protein